MQRAYYTQAAFGDLYVFDKEALVTRKVRTNAENQALGKPYEYIIDARDQRDLIINNITDPNLMAGSNVYVLGSTFNEMKIAHVNLRGAKTKRTRWCNIQGPVICTYTSGAKSNMEVNGVSAMRFVDFDGHGDENYLGTWKDRFVDFSKWGCQILNQWDGNKYDAFGIGIGGHRISYCSFEGFLVSKSLFGSTQSKSDWYRDLDGYNQYGMSFRWNYFYRPESEAMYMGQTGRTSPEQYGKGNGDGLQDSAVDGSWSLMIDPVFEYNVCAFTGTEAIQMQRMLGNFKIRWNVVICPDAKVLHGFQLSQQGQSQYGMFNAGPDAEHAYNLYIGGGEGISYFEYGDAEFPKAEQYDVDYFPAPTYKGYFQKGGAVDFHHNLMWGCRKQFMLMRKMSGNMIQHRCRENWFADFRSDMHLLTTKGGVSDMKCFWLYSYNNFEPERFNCQNNKIDKKSFEAAGGQVIISGELGKKYADGGGNDFNADVEEPQFVPGGIVARDWHKYHVIDKSHIVTKSQAENSGRTHILRPGVDINGIEVSIKTSTANGEGYPHVFNVGDVVIIEDTEQIFRRINTPGNSSPITRTAIFDQGDGTLHTNGEWRAKNGTKLEQTIEADTVNWEPTTLPIQAKLVEGSYYDLHGLGLRPSAYELKYGGGTPPPDPEPVESDTMDERLKLFW